MPAKKPEQIDISYKTFVKFFLVLGGVFLITVGIGGFDQLAGLISGSIFNSRPLFDSTDSFVLFGSEEVVLEEGTQVSSGDLGSNKNLDLQKDVIANGNLFADKITLDKNAVINGGVSYNNLQLKKDSQILGTQTKPVQLPIANLPDIPDFQTGTQDFNFTGTSTSNILNPGNYKNIIVEKNSRLTLAGGIPSTSSGQVYNLSKLEVKENSVLIFATSTTLNIKDELFAQQKVSILPGANTIFDDLKINFKSQKPVEFGKRSLLNFKLLAPNAQVHIGEEATIRGQILAKKIKIEKGSVLSKELTGFKIAKPEDIITDSDGGVYPINELLISLIPGTTFSDAISVANNIKGRVMGNVVSINLYQIETPTRTIQELEDLIDVLRLDATVLGVSRNFIIPPTVFPIDRFEILENFDEGFDELFTPKFEMAVQTIILIFTTPFRMILFIIGMAVLAFLLYKRRGLLLPVFTFIVDKLFYSKLHLGLFVVSAIVSDFFLVFNAQDVWVIGVPFDTVGDFFVGISLVGFIGNAIFTYVILFLILYIIKTIRVSRIKCIVAIILFFILIIVATWIVYQRIIEARNFFWEPSIFGLLRKEARAQDQVLFDLQNLRNQNSLFTKAYDIIKTQEAWEKIIDSNPSLATTSVGIVDFGVEATHQEFNNPQVDFGSIRRVLFQDFIEGGHGTQVAGIIGANNASRNDDLSDDSPQMNGILSGVLTENQYTLEFKPIGGPRKATTSSQIVVFAALESVIAKNSQVVNMSFGEVKCSALSIDSRKRKKQLCYKTDKEFDDDFNSYRKLFQQASTTLFVGPAGNEAINSVNTLPSALGFLDNVITIGGTDLGDKRWSSSNFDSLISVSAPAIGVYAPSPNNGYVKPRVDFFGIVFGGFDGTSASTPIVTGVTDLLKAIKSNLTPVQLKQILIETADVLTTNNSNELSKSLGPISGPINCNPDNVSNARGCRLNALNAVTRVLPVKISSLTSTSTIEGQTLNITITGENFYKGKTTVDFGLGITVNSSSVASSTEMVANITITPIAVPGTRNITVIKQDPGGSSDVLENSFTVLSLKLPKIL